MTIIGGGSKSSSFLRQLLDKPKIFDKLKSMRKLTLKNGATIQSGNVVEFNDGSIRRVIEVGENGKLLFLYANADPYADGNTYAYTDTHHYTYADSNFYADRYPVAFAYTDAYLNRNVVKVYEGLLAGRYDITGWSNYKSTKVLWEKKNSTVKLNDEYTATIEGDEVVVGCQRIPLDKVRELVKLADEGEKR